MKTVFNTQKEISSQECTTLLKDFFSKQPTILINFTVGTAYIIGSGIKITTNENYPLELKFKIIMPLFVDTIILLIDKIKNITFKSPYEAIINYQLTDRMNLQLFFLKQAQKAYTILQTPYVNQVYNNNELTPHTRKNYSKQKNNIHIFHIAS